MKQVSLETATKGGNSGQCVEVLALILARAIDECESKRDLASLSRRYMDLMGLFPSTSDEGIDDLIKGKSGPDLRHLSVV